MAKSILSTIQCNNVKEARCQTHYYGWTPPVISQMSACSLYNIKARGEDGKGLTF